MKTTSALKIVCRLASNNAKYTPQSNIITKLKQFHEYIIVLYKQIYFTSK